MENIALIGIDLGKNSFHIHCQDHRGKAVYRKKFTRPKLIEFLATCPATTIAMEGVVCGRGRDPTLRLWPPIFSGEIDMLPSQRRDMGQQIGR